ncbi:ribonuclease H-like domain-containing protein [Suillus occidentalis]|nr:ribonuclease H-like domain-containing protein [Suillus occidentalis]
MRGLNIIEDKVTIYTDGSCLHNGKYNAKSGSGIWISEENERNKKIRIPVILIALQQTEPYIPITFITDSRYAIDGLTKYTNQWEDKGWIDIVNSDYLKAALYHLRKRSAQTSFIWTKGHNGNQGNEQADRLALEGKSQGDLEHDSAIWTGCRNKDIQKTIHQFLFKAMHGAYHIEIESLEHILLELWKLTKELWPPNLGTWPKIRLGTILGCGNLHLKKQIHNEQAPDERENNNDNEMDDKTKGAARLLRILISEATYLIWIIRCNSTINETTYTTDNIVKRWTNRINNRLQLDRISARKIIRTKKFTKLVTHTWENTIQINHNTGIQEDWATALEVLVGIRPPRPSTNEAP